MDLNLSPLSLVGILVWTIPIMGASLMFSFPPAPRNFPNKSASLPQKIQFSNWTTFQWHFFFLLTNSAIGKFPVKLLRSLGSCTIPFLPLQCYHMNSVGPVG